MTARRSPFGRSSGKDGICSVPTAGLLGSQHKSTHRQKHRWVLWGLVAASFVTYAGSLGVTGIETEKAHSERTMIGTNDEHKTETFHESRHHLTESFFKSPKGERWATTVTLVEQSKLGDTIIISTRLIDHDQADNPEDTDDRGAVAVALCQDANEFFTPQNLRHLPEGDTNVSVRVQELGGATLATNRVPDSSSMECEEY